MAVNLSKQVNVVTTIAYRDVMKFLRDRMRIVFSFIFPILFVGVLGSSLQAGLGAASGKDLLTFTFVGVLAQTMFQSTAAGIISLINDRENDFSQELFVSPTSRYAIIFGKIIGESAVSFFQAIGIILFGFIIGIKISLLSFLFIIPAALIAALLGGAFGVLVLGNLNNERTANQIFPFLLFPQLFLAGVFVPITSASPVLYFFSKLAPLTYAVDFMRNAFDAGNSPTHLDTVHTSWINLVVMAAMFVVFLSLGTYLFVKKERER